MAYLEDEVSYSIAKQNLSKLKLDNHAQEDLKMIASKCTSINEIEMKMVIWQQKYG
jgi:hypothetical protein